MTETERTELTPDEQDGVETTSQHWMHIVKTVGIVGKIAIVVAMMVVAIYMYVTKYKKCTMIPIILAFYIGCLLILILLDMTSKYIAGFFLLIYLSNLFNFLGFYKILHSLPGAPGVKLRSRTRYYFLTMSVLYAITLGLAFMPRFGPWCTAEKVYPAVMNWTSCLFIINFVFHLVINWRKDFFFAEGPIVADAENQDDSFLNLSQVSDGQKEKLLDWKDEERADKLAKRMFRSQMNVYLWFQLVLVICNIAIQLWGRIFIHKSNFLGCSDKGWQWEYTTITGELFVGAHMVLIITQAVMLEQAVYKVPKKLGWFNHSEQEVQLADNFPQAKPAEAQDDFKSINN